jgi:sterol O-acyltransferase
MDEKINQLITHLQEIKQEKLEKDKQINKLVEEFNDSHYKLKNSKEQILERISELSQQLSVGEEIKENFLNNFNTNTQNLKIKSKEKKYLPYKKFKLQDSLLIHLFEKEEFQTIYNMFMSLMIILLANFIFAVILDEKNLFNKSLFENLFKGFFTTIKYSSCLGSLSIILVVIINVLKSKVISKSTLSILFFSILTYIFIYFSYVQQKLQISFICNIIFSSELLRFTFKMIAYFSEKVLLLSHNLYHKENNLKSSQDIHNTNTSYGIVIKDNGLTNEIFFDFRIIDLKKECWNFLYFYIAPTMIYRDLYPVAKKVNISTVIMHFVNAFLALLFNFIIFELLLIPFINDKKLTFLEPSNILQSIINFTLISMLVLFVVFWGVAHSYFNLFAEIMRFGDRKFYGGFWNARHPKAFYQKLSHNFFEFFQYYIYQLLNKFISSSVSYSLTIIFFCFVIEFIFVFSFGYFYPLTSFFLLTTHLISYVLEKIKDRRTTFITWMTVTISFGTLIFVNLTIYFTFSSGVGDNFSLNIIPPFYMKILNFR